jgi:hypothetical protein
MVRVEAGLMTTGDEAAYAALLGQSTLSPFSHTLPYRDVLIEGGLGDACYFVARRGPVVRAALPMFVKRSPYGAVMNSLPLVQSAGGVIVADDSSDDERRELNHALVKCALNHAAQNDVMICVFIGTAAGTIDAPNDCPADFAIDRTTHLLDLTKPLALQHAAKEGVRKAGLVAPAHHVARTEEEAKQVWQLYDQSMQRMNVHARPWSFYERLRRHGGKSVRFVWCSVNGEATTGFVLLCNNGVVDYHSVGNTPLGRKHQTNSWLCLEELQWARSQGYRRWNWGASPTPEVGAFKQRFGGMDQTYPLRGYCIRDVSVLRSLSATQLTEFFPDYFVLPYSWLGTSKLDHKS